MTTFTIDSCDAISSLTDTDEFLVSVVGEAGRETKKMTGEIFKATIDSKISAAIGPAINALDNL